MVIPSCVVVRMVFGVVMTLRQRGGLHVRTLLVIEFWTSVNLCVAASHVGVSAAMREDEQTRSCIQVMFVEGCSVVPNCPAGRPYEVRRRLVRATEPNGKHWTHPRRCRWRARDEDPPLALLVDDFMHAQISRKQYGENFYEAVAFS